MTHGSWLCASIRRGILTAQHPNGMGSPLPYLGQRLPRATSAHAAGKYARGYAPELPHQALAEQHVVGCGLEGLTGVGPAPGGLRTEEAPQAPAETRAERLGGLPGCGKRATKRCLTS